jgi:mannose-6-phosphate isomerase-like protein (cupin superfamily)
MIVWKQRLASSESVLKTLFVQEAIQKARRLAERKLADGMNADEFVEIAEADGFRIYVTAGKTIDYSSSYPFHENPRDVFMWVIEGEIEFLFGDKRKTVVKSGECFVLPKHLKHQCIFKKLTIAVEGVYEKGL